MNSVPLVSVIVITYNSEKYVIDTLNSIKSQNYKNLELLISDDCSTDNTLDICKKWIEKEKSNFINTEIITTKINTGIPGNCNRGVNVAKGEWIKIIAGDDLLLENCIQLNIDFVRKNNDIKILYSEAEKIDESGKILPQNTQYYKNQFFEWKLFFMKQTVENQLKLYARNPFFLVSPSLFVNKNHLKEIDGFDENIRIYEDIPFILKSLNSGQKIHYLPENTVIYRIHDQSISKNNPEKKYHTNLMELVYIYKKYRLHNLRGLNFYNLGCRFEAWLQNIYVLKLNLKGARYLAQLNPFKIYQKRIIKQLTD